MKFLTVLILLFSSRAFAELSVSKEKETLKKIASEHKGNSEKQRAQRCQAFGQFLLENKGQSEIVTLKDEPVFSVKSIDLSPMDRLDEETLQIYNDLFNSCRFEINKAFIGFCAECKGLQRITIPLFVIQKVDSNTYFSNLTDTTKGLGVSNRYAVIQTDQPKSTQGHYSTVLLQAGSTEVTMLNGFNKRQNVVLEIGFSRSSAIFCRFNQFIKNMTAKYKSNFKCGYYLNDSEFYESSSASLICAPASDFDKNGKDKRRNLWIADFDYKECR